MEQNNSVGQALEALRDGALGRRVRGLSTEGLAEWYAGRRRRGRRMAYLCMVAVAVAATATGYMLAPSPGCRMVSTGGDDCQWMRAAAAETFKTSLS